MECVLLVISASVVLISLCVEVALIDAELSCRHLIIASLFALAVLCGFSGARLEREFSDKPDCCDCYVEEFNG